MELFNGTRISSTLQGDRSSAIGEREADRQRVRRQRKRDSKVRRGAERADWSNRFGVYETDFGWGRPAKVEITSIDRGLTIGMAESKD
ncbi:hypothetical protein LR48_Vigan843s003000 [Vigna angularis]|uniref:Uncharacterized protein n=1 Tax=Phaseolus angularis TaxID=3914 RepID=A0A0L9TH97_PHAAN|nr:hypothetical protein LR48_Vigan843s003000 [Vigna angularis]